MANGILKQLNRSLELTLRDSLDALEDFTLQMAYSGTMMSFEILSPEGTSGAKVEAGANPVSLKLVDNPAPQDEAHTPVTPRQRRA